MNNRLLLAGVLLIPATFVILLPLALVTTSLGTSWLTLAVFLSGELDAHLWPFVLVSYFLIPPVIFWTTGCQLFWGQTRVGIHSFIVLLILAASSLSYFQSVAAIGLSHQGKGYVTALICANVAAILSLLILAIWGRVRPTLSRSFWFHWLLALWTGSLAFAYLGGTP